MPLYEYRCVACKTVTAYLRPSDKRDQVATCSECGCAARRIVSLPQRHRGVWQEPVDGEKLNRTKEIWE